MTSKQVLLAKYLSSDVIPEGVTPQAFQSLKKKKKKVKTGVSAGVAGATTRIIDEDDDFGGSRFSSNQLDEDENTPQVYTGVVDESAMFSKGSWEVIREGDAPAVTAAEGDASTNIETAAEGSSATTSSFRKVAKKRKAGTVSKRGGGGSDLDDPMMNEEEFKKLEQQLRQEAEQEAPAETVMDVKRMMEEQGIQVVLDENVDLSETMGFAAVPTQSLELRAKQKELERAARKHDNLASRSRKEVGSLRRRRSPTPSDDERDRRKSRRRRSPTPSDDDDRDSERRRRRRSPSASSIDEGRSDANGKRKRMEDGGLAGLQSAEEVRQHSENKRRLEMDRLSKMDASFSGRDAETVYRDKHGRLIDIEKEREAEEAKERQRQLEEQEKLKYKEGIVQKRMREFAQQRLEHEKKAAFANTVEDKEWNEELKEQDRWGDPLAGLGVSSSSKKKKSDRPKYKGPPPPPNRYKIPPGYRWDGVDRSNGFEQKLFQNKYSKAARVEEAYKWSTEDM